MHVPTPYHNVTSKPQAIVRILPESLWGLLVELYQAVQNPSPQKSVARHFVNNEPNE